MKKCSKCNETKPLELFSKSSKTKDGRHTWCKSCFSIYEKLRYKNGDRKRKENNAKKSKERSRTWLWNLLQQSSCMDCGESDPIVLEFDHRDPTTKKYTVVEMVGHSISTIQAEINKCDIVCANCHRRRTNKQFGWWRYNR